MYSIFRQRQRRPDRAVYVPRGRRSQTTPRATAATTPSASSASHSASVPKSSVLHKESENVITTPNSMVSPSQSTDIIETNSQKSEMTPKAPTVKEQPLINHKHDVSQQQTNCHTDLTVGQDESLPPTKVEMVDSMAEADHKNANGSNIEMTVNSCDKDYNEEKEFQRASKVHNSSENYSMLSLKLTYDF